jgi:ATP-dependent HslUV protease ATP-binding subunit HslU
MEKVMEDISYRAEDLSGQTIVVDEAYVNARMADVPLTDEASKYIL